MAQTDLTIAGVGGQGSILAGVILGSAAVTFDHRYATQTQAYSSELRGGFAATWVIVSDQPIEYPRVIQSDILVAQAQDSIDRFGAALKSSGILIVDSDMVRTHAAECQESISRRSHLDRAQRAEGASGGEHCHARGLVQDYRNRQPQGVGGGDRGRGSCGQGSGQLERLGLGRQACQAGLTRASRKRRRRRSRTGAALTTAAARRCKSRHCMRSQSA